MFAIHTGMTEINSIPSEWRKSMLDNIRDWYVCSNYVNQWWAVHLVRETAVGTSSFLIYCTSSLHHRRIWNLVGIHLNSYWLKKQLNHYYSLSYIGQPYWFRTTYADYIDKVSHRVLRSGKYNGVFGGKFFKFTFFPMKFKMYYKKTTLNMFSTLNWGGNCVGCGGECWKKIPNMGKKIRKNTFDM